VWPVHESESQEGNQVFEPLVASVSREAQRTYDDAPGPLCKNLVNRHKSSSHKHLHQLKSGL
jgi:hypothetical protein